MAFPPLPFHLENENPAKEAKERAAEHRVGSLCLGTEWLPGQDFTKSSQSDGLELRELLAIFDTIDHSLR